MRYFDTHCHLGLIHDDRLEQLVIVQYAKRAGVKHIVSICNSLTDFEVVYNNLKSASGVYHAVGVSPSESGNRIDGWEAKMTDVPVIASYSKREKNLLTAEPSQFSKLKDIMELLDILVSSRYPNSITPLISAHAEAAIPFNMGQKLFEQIARQIIEREHS